MKLKNTLNDKLQIFTDFIQEVTWLEGFMLFCYQLAGEMTEIWKFVSNIDPKCKWSPTLFWSICVFLYVIWGHTNKAAHLHLLVLKLMKPKPAKLVLYFLSLESGCKEGLHKVSLLYFRLNEYLCVITAYWRWFISLLLMCFFFQVNHIIINYVE